MFLFSSKDIRAIYWYFGEQDKKEFWRLKEQRKKMKLNRVKVWSQLPNKIFYKNAPFQQFPGSIFLLQKKLTTL